MTNYNERLDEMLRSLAHQAYLTAHAPGYTKLDGRTYKTAVDEAKQAILDWHNKQVEEVLDRLDKSMPTAEQLTTKYGYHMPEKQYGYKLGLHDIREVIQAERNKLKESKYE